MKDFQPQITAFCCHNAAYSPEDLTKRQRLQYPSNVKVIEIPCSGKTEVLYFLKAFESGADGVYVVGCPEGVRCAHPVRNCKDPDPISSGQGVSNWAHRRLRLTECHFLEGNLRAKKRVQYTQQLLDEIGIEKERIQMYNLSSSMKEKFLEAANEMIEKIKNIGPNPLNKVKRDA